MLRKILIGKAMETVYDGAIARIEWSFAHFEHVCVSFSGGKDSGVMLNLTIDYAKKNNLLTRMSVFHIDYECAYTDTIKYVDQTLDSCRELGIAVYRICLPIAAQCATSMFQDHWNPWEESEKELWVRPMPEDSINITNAPDFFYENIRDYEFQEKFAEWLRKKIKAKNLAAFIGIRTQESLQRYSAIEGKTKINRYQNKKFTTVMTKNIVNVYPLFDWKTEDIWTCNAKNNYTYNKIYDLYYLAGVSLHDMRVASPFCTKGISSLHLFRALDPNMWSKMVSRVNGVKFAGLLGNTSAMGWRKISKPESMTWKEYAEFLLSTYPEPIADNFRKKLDTSMVFWATNGAYLDNDTIERLKDKGIKVKPGKTKNYRTDKTPIIIEEYMDDIDDPSFRLLPTYKRFVMCMLKNDYDCTTMGFGPTKIQEEKRKDFMQKYANL